VATSVKDTNPMLQSLALPIALASVALGWLWWLGRSRADLRPVPVAAAAGRVADGPDDTGV
jgi:hypothetical protein